jgi:RimJ/RimL family protein N-acetyltransferase
MSIRSIIKRLKKGKTGKFCKRILFRLFRYGHFLLLYRDNPSDGGPNEAGIARVRAATTVDLPALLKLVDDNEYPIEKMMKKGDFCFVAEQGGRIVGMLWLELRNKHVEEEINYSFIIPPHSAWSFSAYVDVQHRGQGIIRELKRWSDRYVKEMGINRLYCLISTDNRASIRANLQLGASIDQEIFFLRLLFMNAFLIQNRQDGKRSFRMKVSLG